MVAVIGAWGSGKTSVISMAMEPLETEGSGFHVVRHTRGCSRARRSWSSTFRPAREPLLAAVSERRESDSVNSTTDIADQMNDHHGLASDATSSVCGASTRGYGGQHRRWPLASTAMVLRRVFKIVRTRVGTMAAIPTQRRSP